MRSSGAPMRWLLSLWAWPSTMASSGVLKATDRQAALIPCTPPKRIRSGRPTYVFQHACWRCGAGIVRPRCSHLGCARDTCANVPSLYRRRQSRLDLRPRAKHRAIARIRRAPRQAHPDFGALAAPSSKQIQHVCPFVSSAHALTGQRLGGSSYFLSAWSGKYKTKVATSSASL